MTKAVSVDGKSDANDSNRLAGKGGSTRRSSSPVVGAATPTSKKGEVIPPAPLVPLDNRYHVVRLSAKAISVAYYPSPFKCSTGEIQRVAAVPQH